ncbi:MAG: UDP-N-acetylmuramoyl-tripeptide--D-alanyl-D-alanine ligase [Pseudomonadota bacterium]
MGIYLEQVNLFFLVFILVKLSALARILQGQLIGQECSYTSVSLDSRSIKAGELFIAISGDSFDGHAFIGSAKDHGAVAALVEKVVPSDIPLVLVKDTRKALGKLAKIHRERFSIPIIGLTGSCGKTTTKEMLRAILSECGSVLASRKSFNNDIGVPLTLLDLTAQHQFAVIEMGANHLGEIAYLSQMSKPDIALITNIAPAHLQGFGSIELVAEAKSEIFLGLSPQGIAVINSDDYFANTWKHRLMHHRVIRFGLGETADFSAKNVHLDSQARAQFMLVTPKGKISIHLLLLGEHNLLNALAAAAVASQVGASLCDIKAGLEKMQGVPGRSMVLESRSGATIIDDTYNANPRSMTAALQLLAHYPGQHIFVMGDMEELGDNASYYHQKMGQLARELGIEHLYTYGKLTALTMQAFGASGKHYSSQEALIQALKPLLQKGVTVLIKGSRHARMEKVVSALVD